MVIVVKWDERRPTARPLIHLHLLGPPRFCPTNISSALYIFWLPVLFTLFFSTLSIGCLPPFLCGFHPSPITYILLFCCCRCYIMSPSPGENSQRRWAPRRENTSSAGLWEQSRSPPHTHTPYTNSQSKKQETRSEEEMGPLISSPFFFPRELPDGRMGDILEIYALLLFNTWSCLGRQSPLFSSSFSWRLLWDCKEREDLFPSFLALAQRCLEEQRNCFPSFFLNKPAFELLLFF